MTQHAFLVSRGSVLQSSILKATSDSMNEFLLRQGVLLSDEDAAEQSRLKGAQYLSTLKSLIKNFSEEEYEYIEQVYIEQWFDTYTFVQDRILKLSKISKIS